MGTKPQTYTIAYTDRMLLGTYPDGTSRDDMLQDMADFVGCDIDPETVHFTDGLILTDKEPAGGARPAWDSQWGIGFLFDEEGTEYRYAVRPMPFIGSADSRETSPEIMAAIIHVAGGDEEEADRIWTEPTPDELVSIWERVTKNGLRDSSEFVWGGSGSDWGAEIEA